MSKQHEWIGVDLDGTLAHYDGWKNTFHIGEPIPAMANRVKRWLAEGREVRIFTARVDGGSVCAGLIPEFSESIVSIYEQTDLIIKMIQDWTEKHFGQRLRVTCRKDYGMVELWDDRCVQVSPNTGQTIAELLEEQKKINVQTRRDLMDALPCHDE